MRSVGSLGPDEDDDDLDDDCDTDGADGADDYSPKVIKMWVLDKENPWNLSNSAYNSDFRARGQPWGKLQVIRVSTQLAKVLMLSPISTLRYPLEAFVPRYWASQYGPMQRRCPYST